MKNPSSSRRARLVIAAVAAVAVGVFASLGATGYAARLVGLSHTTPQADQYPPSKVTICHHTHSQKNPFVTITVSEHALPAHLGHGDTVGACPEQAPTTPVQPVKPQKQHAAHELKQHGNKGHTKGHGKPAQTTSAGKTHGRSDAAHGNGKAHTTGPSTVHGKSQGHGKAHDPAHGNGKGKGKDKGQGGHSPSHGPGNGHGQGNGQGQHDTHGNSGGGKGNGHKP